MQTLTINIDDSYLEQILNFLQQIPKNKREIFYHKKIDMLNFKPSSKNSNFLEILENGFTISQEEADKWEKNIRNGYKSWTIQKFQ